MAHDENHNGRIDREWVLRWSERYPVKNDHRVFATIGPEVAARGYFRREEFLAVGDWKSPRPRKRLVANSDADIEDITRAGLAAPERLRHRVLTLLSGVQRPMASALLAVADPGRYTVIDYRAIETLVAHHELDSHEPSYMHYLAQCRDVAARTGVDLRTLDRALWKWSKDKGTEPKPDDDLDKDLPPDTPEVD